MRFFWEWMLAMTDSPRTAAAAAYYSARVAPTTCDLEAPARRRAGRRPTVNTAIFSLATGLSRVAGVVREIVAS